MNSQLMPIMFCFHHEVNPSEIIKLSCDFQHLWSDVSNNYNSSVISARLARSENWGWEWVLEQL
jgi:hypothetical protein